MQDYALGSTIDIKFNTANAGVPITLAGTPSVAAYPDNSTTEITAGITLTVDVDARTGLHNVRVVATSGNGYAAGGNYTLVLTAGTVNGTSMVGAIVGAFSLEAVSALRPTTAGRTLDVSASGEAGLDWGNIGSPTTTQNLSGTAVKTATDVETDTQDLQTRVPAALGANGNIKADVRDFSGTAGTFSGGRPEVNATHLAGTAQTARDIGASVLVGDKTGFSLTSAYDAAKTAAQAGDAMALTSSERTSTATAVWASATRTLTSISGLGIALATKLTKYVQLLARKDAAIATDNATELTEINADGGSGAGAFANTTDAQEAIRDNMGTPQTGDAYARLGAPAGVSVSADVAAVKSDTGAIKVKTDNLPASPAATGDIPSAAAVADQVWEETLADHSGTSGSTAAALNAAGSAGDPWNTALPGSYGSGTAGKILGDNLNATVSSRASQTSVDDLPTNAELATALAAADDAVLAAIAALNNLSQANIRTAVGLASANLDTQLSTIDDFLDTEIAAIKAKTDALPSDPADASDIAASFASIASTLATIAGYLDTEVAAIKAKTDNLPSDPADESQVEAAITAAQGAITTAIAALNNLSAAQVKTQADQALADVGLTTTVTGRVDAAVSTRASQVSVDTIDDFLDTEIAAIKAVTDQLVAAQAEPAAVPAANATPLQKIAWLAALARNKVTQTATTQTLRNDADSADIATAGVSDDGSVFTRAEWQ